MKAGAPIAALSALALAACGIIDGSSRLWGESAVVITGAQNGTGVDVPAGSRLEVRLSGNSTIYPPDNWQVEALPNNLRGVGETSYESDSPGAMGAGGTAIFQFTAVAPGTGQLSFNSGPSQHRFAVTINVR